MKPKIFHSLQPGWTPGWAARKALGICPEPLDYASLWDGVVNLFEKGK